jgi:hypothetical protein
MLKKSMFLYVLSVLLSGCFFIPCNTTLQIINEDTNGLIILIDRNGDYIEHKIDKNEKKYFDNNIMNNIQYVYIKNVFIEGIFELREFDHWFPANHNIKIIIGKNEFIIENDRKNIVYINSYDQKYLEYNNEILDFETIKILKYNNIYEIIKDKFKIEEFVFDEIIPYSIEISINDLIILNGSIVLFNGWFPNIRMVIDENKIIGIVENDISIELVHNLLENKITGQGVFKLKYNNDINLPYYENPLMIFEIMEYSNIKNMY